jgi:hypothetical protein
VVDKFLLQLETQLAEKSRGHLTDTLRKAWVKKGFDLPADVGARPGVHPLSVGPPSTAAPFICGRLIGGHDGHHGRQRRGERRRS